MTLAILPRRLSAALLLSLSTIASASVVESSSTDIGFLSITNNSGTSSSFESGLSLSLSDLGGAVSFVFGNTVGDGSIANVYFDGLGLLNFSSATVLSSSGVSFSLGGSPSNVPSGNTVSFSSDFSVSAANPKPSNGVNTGETLTVSFDLTSGTSFSDVVSGISSGDLRVGLHVISLGSNSESFVSTLRTDTSVTAVPEPETYAMMLAGLGLLGTIARRRNR